MGTSILSSPMFPPSLPRYKTDKIFYLRKAASLHLEYVQLFFIKILCNFLIQMNKFMDKNTIYLQILKQTFIFWKFKSFCFPVCMGRACLCLQDKSNKFGIGRPMDVKTYLSYSYASQYTMKGKYMWYVCYELNLIKMC